MGQGFHFSKETAIRSNPECLCVFPAGDYICRLTIDVFAYWSTKKVVVTPIRILAQENMKVMCDNNPVFLNCCSEITANWSKIEWKQEGSISIPGELLFCE